MKGQVVATLFAICLSSSVCSAQIYGPSHDTFGNHGRIFDNPHASNLAGIVIGSDGKPVGDARIEIRNAQTGVSLATGYTTQGGNFEFENLPAATYEVVASQGLAQTSQRLTVTDMGMNLTLHLSNANAAAAKADGNSTVSVAEYRVPQKARDAYHKAEVALAKKHSDEAAKQLAKALEIDANYAPALTLRGVLSLDAEHFEAAMNDFDQAVHADPNYPLAYTAMAAAFNQLKKFDEALRSADRAITLAPRSWQSYFEMAKAYVGKADYQHALQQTAKAQALSSVDYAPMHLLRAHAMLALKNYSEAINELEAFLTLAPQDPNSPAARQALEKVKAFTASATAPQAVIAPR
jgi:tetratricopeptide (TPR) repeat protein